MATQNKISTAFRYCRDCGGETTTVAGIDEVWCLNTAPKPLCRNLSPSNRNFCELCGCADPGPGACPKCGRAPPRR